VRLRVTTSTPAKINNDDTIARELNASPNTIGASTNANSG